MGYIRHHGMVFTSYKKEGIKTLHEKVSKLLSDMGWAGFMITPIIESPVNTWFTFFIAPDGSKEGWEDSINGDSLRKEIINTIEECRIYVSYAEFYYGDDGGFSEIVNHS